MISSFDSVKEKICFKLINAEKNQELLQDVPHIPFMDLAIVFYVLVGQSSNGNATALVRNSMMQLWGNPDVYDIYDLAKMNTQRLFRGHVASMMEVMSGIIAENDNVDSDLVDAFFSMDVYEDNFMPMFVATNKSKINGASVILYDGLLAEFARRVGGDFYILPSSIHETILLPATGEMDVDWGNKEIKDWAFVRDEVGNIVIDETHPDWWQDKKNPERYGIRIPVMDADGNQKLDSRNRKQWKREVADATGWNNPKNCELWRSEWAKECNLHLKKEQQIDH